MYWSTLILIHLKISYQNYVLVIFESIFHVLVSNQVFVIFSYVDIKKNILKKINSSRNAIEYQIVKSELEIMNWF